MTAACRLYAVGYEPKALKELAKFDKQVARRVVRAVDALATDPRPNGALRVAHRSGAYRHP